MAPGTLRELIATNQHGGLSGTKPSTEKNDADSILARLKRDDPEGMTVAPTCEGLVPREPLWDTGSEQERQANPKPSCHEG